MYRLIRPLLFRLPPESAHHLGFGLLRAGCAIPGLKSVLRRYTHRNDRGLGVHALGLDFPNPIGVAAGFDKNALGFEALGALGFGFVEVGTLTAKAQPGNAKPRIFRLPKDRALINRLGFNNSGAADAVSRLQKSRKTIVGVNIGKTKVTPLERAREDYVESTRLLAPYADYLVVNVSSPNTPGLRKLQSHEELSPLLREVRKAADQACAQNADSVRKRVPLLVKIAPDLDNDGIDEIADIAMELGLDGIIATNTTISRASVQSDVEHLGAGGLSGRPLRARSVDVLHRLKEKSGGKLTLISAGGVETAEDVAERLDAGASLVQLYTSFVYEGPALPMRITEGLQTLGRRALSSKSQGALHA